MSNCDGRGKCFIRCQCLPSNSCEYKDIAKFIGGPEDVYIKADGCVHNCQLIECYNYVLCEQKRPRYLLDQKCPLCYDCSKKIGEIVFSGSEEFCSICTDYKPVIYCGEIKACADCWKKPLFSANRSLALSEKKLKIEDCNY